MAEGALRKNEETFRIVTSSLAEGIYVMDKLGNITFMNPEAERLLGWTIAELSGKNAHDIIHYRKADGSPLSLAKCFIHKVMESGVPCASRDEVFVRKDGTFFPITVISSPIIEKGKIVAAVAAFRDISEEKALEKALQRSHKELETKVLERTSQLENMIEQIKTEILEHKKTARELKKANRTLLILSKCNDTLVHATDEKAFLSEICRIITEEGHHLLAWIGYAQQDEEKSVLSVAHAGQEYDHLSTIRITWEDNEGGRGPTGTAIRTGKVQVLNNLFDAPNFTPWREEAARKGVASIISLPLIDGTRPIGALTIYSSDMDSFNEDEGLLLNELADNIAFGITSLQMRAKNRIAEEELRLSNEKLRNLAAHLQSVREEERTKIAREIHDELGQALSAQKMELSWFREKYGDHKSIFDKAGAMLEALNTTIRSVRRICTALRPSILDDFGLIEAMKWQATEFQARTRIECVVDTVPEEFEVDKARSTPLFRIFQEALTNVLKHAKATKVTAILTKGADNITLEVIDNGRGMTDEQLSKPQSFGLMGMRERVYPWGGMVEITGYKNKGTKVRVSMPN